MKSRKVSMMMKCRFHLPTVKYHGGQASITANLSSALETISPFTEQVAMA